MTRGDPVELVRDEGNQQGQRAFNNVILEDPTTGTQAAVESNGALAVNIQDQHTQMVDFYLLREDATPALTAPVAIDDTVLAVTSNAGITDGDAINIHEGIYFYQSLVVSTTANSITVATPVDANFTANAVIHVGPWNAAVNGAVTPQIFECHPPPGVHFDIYGITFSGLDDLDMDSTTFIGIVDGITNGILIRQTGTGLKNQGLIVNNLGFEEFGYYVTYQDANKHSEYGMIAKKNFHIQNGVSIRLQGGVSPDLIEVVIRDDLSSQSLFAIIIHGHVVTD